MALVYSEGFDYLNGNVQVGYEGWYVYNTGYNFNMNNGKFPVEVYESNGDTLGGGLYIAQFYGNGINASYYSGTINGTVPSPLGGAWVLAPSLFTVTHPTEIRFAFWVKIPQTPYDVTGVNGKWWIFRLRDYTGNAGIALWPEISALNNGISLSKFHANVGSQVAPVFNTSTSTATASPWTGRWGDGQYHHIEVRFVAANGVNSSGIVQAWIDRQPVINVSSVVTSNANTIDLTVLNSIEFSSTQVDIYFDDVIVWDNTGNTMNSGPIGPHRIRTFLPRANGSYTGQFTGYSNTGGNWFAVSEYNRGARETDSDSSYVEGITAGYKDSYRMTWANSNIGTINGIVVKPIIKNPDIGTKTYSMFVRGANGAESNLGKILVANTSYGVPKFIFNTDPATNTAWTSANVNLFEVGIQVES